MRIRNLFPFEWSCTGTRFETEACSNSDMGYSYSDNLLKAREKSRVQVAIVFGFSSHWLINWREFFKPMAKRSNCNRVITFDSHLKTALSPGLLLQGRFSNYGG